nr:NADH dehydrogenase subunit 6 [Sebastapistes fowleri]
MTYIMFMFLLGLVLGMVAVASNPSPYFAALGLVVVAGMGCGALVGYGGSFLSLVLFLIYLGGMLVVFAYSAALAAEPHPESFGSGPVFLYMVLYSVGSLLAFSAFWMSEQGVFHSCADDGGGLDVFRGDVGGVALMYSSGGGMLVIGAWVLLLTLFVVLEMTRGLSRGSLRAV